MSIRAAFDSKWQILRIAVVMLSPSQNRRQPSAQKADLNNPYFSPHHRHPPLILEKITNQSTGRF
jgi:hypothetical protein